VTTGSELYREGLADTIVMTGGIEHSGVDETVVMRDLAVSQWYHLPRIKLAYARAGLDA